MGGVATAEAGSVPITFTTGVAAAEMERILKQVETAFTESDFSARDLHTLASLVSMLAKYVSRLAKEKDEAGKRASGQGPVEETPEPED